MSITKLKSGKYQVRYRDGDRHRARSFALKGDAQAFERSIQHQKQTRGVVTVDRGKTRLRDHTERWWHSPDGLALTPATRQQYQSLSERFVQPQLGSMELRQITPRVLTEWQAKVSSQANPPTLLKLHGFMKGLFKFAVLMEELEYNPMREISRPKVPHKLAPAPIPVGFVEALRTTMKPRDATLISVLAYMGLRPGEALRLLWEDIGETTARVYSTKTNRERSVPVLAPVLQDLTEWSLLSGSSEGLVFPGIDWKNWTNRVWKPAVRDLGLPKSQRPYELRSTFVSLMAADPNVTILQVARWAGHTLAVMDAHYAGIIEEASGKPRSAVDVIQGARRRSPAREPRDAEQDLSWLTLSSD